MGKGRRGGRMAGGGAFLPRIDGRPGFPGRLRRTRGFTFVEVTIVAALSLMLLLFIQSFFSSGIRSTLKGTDTLESIRAASLLFAQIRKDLMACQSIQTGAASVTMGVNALNLPAAFPVSDLLTFCARNATTTYSLQTSPRGKFILRTFTPTVGPTETRSFGIPRVKAFEVVQVKKHHRILSTLMSPSQLLVNVVIDSDDPRVPTKEIRLSSVFISQQMYNTNWNYFFP